jgi:hypothetical protein
MPDEELFRLAEQRKLQDPAVLSQQVDRMLDDPRLACVRRCFVGQWLGTQEIGGRAVPLLTELQHFYTPEVAADLREQPQLFLQYIVTANRPVLDLLNAPYTFLNERLANITKSRDKVTLHGTGFQKVDWPDSRAPACWGWRASPHDVALQAGQPGPPGALGC